MAREKQKAEWIVFGPAFWDEDTLVAKSDDGAWVYPSRGFNPKPGQYYYATLIRRVSKTSNRPYYIAQPRHGGAAEPPPEFTQLLQKLAAVESQIGFLRDENEELKEEAAALRQRLAEKHHMSLRENDLPVKLTPRTIEKMLQNCSIEELLGAHSDEKRRKVYRQLMQLIHPDKTRNFGEKTVLILEELVKAINARYHQR